jgi:tetratricopeptide (TPR) repeat protein
MKHAWIALSLASICSCRASGGDAGLVATPSSAEGAHRIEGLGRIEFPNSGPAAAQEPFVRGMLLLHSFEYVDAAEAFREAQAVAPGFALAYWGEALTHCHPIWQEEDRDAACAVLARLAPTPAERAARAGDARERALVEAVDTLFGEGTRSQRAQAYCKCLEALHARHPDDLEIAALYSLSILGTATQGRDIPTYMRAAAVAEEVLERAPDHPGALHYAIHSYDDPTHAPLGLRMARRYGVVAAAAEHALHMPSHVYVALGMWRDSVASNVAASNAADRRREQKQLGIDKRGFHSLLWLAYSYLQLGETEPAERLLADMRRDESASSSKRTRLHLILMRASTVVAEQSWGSETAEFEVDCAELDPAATCAELYVRGRHALAGGDVERARAALRSMGERLAPSAPIAQPGAEPGAKQCCATPGGGTYLPDMQAARVIELELTGLAVLAEGSEEDGLARLAEAAAAEDAMGFDFGPPSVVEPAHELLGHALLERGRFAEAAREFEAALERAPGRARSVQGLARARAKLG